MRSYKYLNKVQNAMPLSFLFCSVIFLIKYLLGFLAAKFPDFETIDFGNLEKSFSSVIPYVFCFFLSYSLLKGKKSIKAFVCTFVLFIFYSFFDSSKSYLFVLIFCLFAYFCYEKFDFYISTVILTFASIIFGILSNILYDKYIDIIMSLSSIISNKGYFTSSSFGFINTFLSAFDINDFEKMFYYKSYGFVKVIDSSVVTGAVNIFKSNIISKGTSVFLSGHYYRLFLLFGVYGVLITKLKGISKITLTVLFATMLLSGNVSLFLLFILLENPYLFIGICVVSSLAYFCADIVNLGMGFIYGGSIVEMFAYINKPVYLFSIGIVFIALGYFLTRYFWERFGFSSQENVYIPKRLKNVVNDLGCVSNILKINSDCIEVRNPKLINSINLDCEIKENKIKLDKSLIDDLKEYIT